MKERICFECGKETQPTLGGNKCVSCDISKGPNMKPQNEGKKNWDDMVEKEAEYKLIPLTQGKFAKVDSDFYPFLSKFKWYAYKGEGLSWYASKTAFLEGKKSSLSMHRYIMGFTKKQIDHINGDGLDNRLCNLRKCTGTQNQANKLISKGSSGKYKGVYLTNKSTRWRSSIIFKGKSIHLGVFDTQEQAAKAYADKAKEIYGDFAKTDFNEKALESE